MNIVSPSLLAADFCNLSSEISRVVDAQWLHVDVMDGHFVTNISVGVPVLESLRKATDKFLDVHLMIDDPEFFVPAFANAGADLICFHLEATALPEQVIGEIRKHGKKVGISIKPKTEPELLLPLLDKVDMVLVMTVEPGYGGQSFMADMLDKIKTIRDEITKRELLVDIQVDGGINLTTAKSCFDAGANIFVAGSAIFGAECPNDVVRELQQLC